MTESLFDDSARARVARAEMRLSQSINALLDAQARLPGLVADVSAARDDLQAVLRESQDAGV